MRAEATTGAHESTLDVRLTAITLSLLSNPSVEDCAVLSRISEVGNIEILAYIVPSGPFVPDRLASYLSAELPDGHLPASYIPLAVLPLTADGKVDEIVLSGLPLYDETLIERWECRLLAEPGISEAAATPLDYTQPLANYHLSDLFGTAAVAAQKVEIQSVQSYVEGLRSAPVRPLAISDGGPLVIPEDAPQTFTEAIHRTAANYPDRGITYVRSDCSELFQSYAALLDRAKRILTGLQQHGLKPGGRIVLQAEALDDHFAAFWACVLGGITPVTVAVAPSYTEQNSVVNKLYNTWMLLDKPVILTNDTLVPSISGLEGLLGMAGLVVLSVDALKSNAPSAEIYPATPESLLFFQLTSGSTGVPKCIQERHHAVICHIHGSAQYNGYTPENVSLNWLPVDHVVPILTVHLKDVYLGCSQVHTKPDVILSSPLKWLDLIEKHHATHTWAPNFGFKLLADNLREQSGKTWDLSSIEYFMNAGEQVTLPVVREFLQLTAPYGVTEKMMQPAFGMAEACTCMTYRNGFSITSDVHRFLKSSLTTDLIEAEPGDEAVIDFVDLGPPMPGVQIRITDSQNQTVREGVIGRFQIKGGVITPGYLNNEKANQEAFVGDGWFNSGDLGYILNGSLTLTGREKEMIIVRGANFYCYEIEDVVNAIPGVEPTYAGASAVEDPATGSEGLAIFFVLKEEARRDRLAVIKAIRARVTASLGITPSQIVPLAKKDFPKTTSGKIQRTQMKTTLLAGRYADILKEIDIALGGANTLPSWFYRTIWRRKDIVSAPERDTKGTALVFVDSSGLGRSENLIDCLPIDSVEVVAGSIFAKLGELRYAVNPASQTDYSELVADLNSNGRIMTEVVHLWTYKSAVFSDRSDFDVSQSLGLNSLLGLVQALAQNQGAPHPVRILVGSSGAQAVAFGDEISLGAAPMLGVIKTISQEMPYLDCRHVDLQGVSLADDAEAVASELANSADREVAYRQGQRFVRRLDLVRLDEQPKSAPALKAGALYLLTGGLGGIALEIARHLISHYNARLLLIGRTDLPTRDKWSNIHPPHVLERIASIRELEALGGKVQYAAVDVADASGLSQAIDAAELDFDRSLAGVFHLAGLYRDQLLAEETVESLTASMRPKIQGALALHEVLADRPDALFVAFSSSTSYFGGAMFGSYAAANRFLDQFCKWRNLSGRPTHCFAWSTWNEVGMNRTVAGKDPLRAAGRGFLEMSAEQALNSLLAGLAYGQQDLIIGLDGGNPNIRRHLESASPKSQILCAAVAGDLSPALTAQLEEMSVADRFGTQSSCAPVRVEQIPRLASGEVDRSALAEAARKKLYGGSERVAPRTERERQLTQVWLDVLGVPQIGIHDNFFELGGHSLLATQVIGRLSDLLQADLSVRLLFESPTVAGLAERVEAGAAKQASASVIVPHSRNVDLPLSFAQQRIWFVEQLEPGSPAYNISIASRLTGDIKVDILQRSLSEIIRRHEVLRTTFPATNGSPVLRIALPEEFRLPVADLRHLPEDERMTEAYRLAAIDLQAPFDMAEGPLIRVHLVQLADDDHVLLVNIHHIVSDGWSMGVFNRELSALYAAYQEGQPSPLPNLKVQYADYAAWQRDWLQGEVLEKQLAYWKEQIAGVPTLLELPLDHPRPPVQTFRGKHKSFTLSRELTDGLNALCRSEGVTLFMALMASFQALLSRYSGQEKFLVSTGIANRNQQHTEELIGCLINILLLRADISDNPTFRQLLSRVRETALGAYANQDLPFEKLVGEIQPDRDLSYNPLTQVMFVLLNAPLQAAEFPGVRTQPLDIETAAAQYDIVVHLYETVDGMAGYLDYYTDIFEPQTIDRILGHFQTILAAVVQDPSQPVAELPILTESERCELISGFNNSFVDFGPARCLQHYFEDHAAQQPDAPAVFYGDTVLSYSELDQRANRLARYLQSVGVGPDVLVGISMERSIEMVVGIIGILKAGGAYVPLDPSYPQERIKFMLEDTQAPVLLTQARLKERFPDSASHIFCLDSEWPAIADLDPTAPECSANPDSLSYVIYTSGSTGQPKGISIRHAGVGNNLLDLNTRFSVGPSDSVLALSSLSFDMCVYEIIGALCAGAHIVIPLQSQLREPMEWAGLIKRHGVTIWNSAPALLKMLVDLVEDQTELWPRTLRVALLGGDWVPVTLPDRLRRLAPGLRFIVMGGATEASIHSTIFEVGDIDPAWRSIPYGHGMSNQTAFILDSRSQIVPIGVPGELHLGGVGLGRGYWKRPELTQEKFIAHPFEPGERLYRTGDLARWRPDGEVELLGRIDYMVKLRGLRIELGEIEAVLRRHPFVREAVVAAKGPDGDKVLTAYIVQEDAASSMGEAQLVQDLRNWVKSHLPDYMTPSAFMFIVRFPLSPNGKVDRKALPDPDLANSEHTAEYAAPRTPTEEIVAGICAAVLNLNRVGRSDNFFEIGGHSLLATQVISRIREAFQVDLPVRTLFESPTVSGLASIVEIKRLAGQEALVPPIKKADRQSSLPVSFAQQRVWIVDQLSTGGNASYNIPGAVVLTGGLDADALKSSLTEIIRRHEILRTTFVLEGRAPIQRISDNANPMFTTVDLTHLALTDREAEALRMAADELRTPFNLARGPLVRFMLYRLDADRHLFFMVWHHIVSDGWSIGLFNKELAALYAATVNGLESPLEELSLQFADFAIWQRDWQQGAYLDAEMAYWKQQLQSVPTTIDLPTDHPRPLVQSFRGARHTFEFPEDLTECVQQFTRTHGATLYMTLLAAFNVLLGSYAGSDDIVVGSPTAGRTRVETENMIGFFINTLVLRTSLAGSPSFSQIVKRVREVVLGATAHQEIQFDRIVEMVRPPRDRSRNPVFQVNFRVQTSPPPALALPGLTSQPVDVLDIATAKFDLALDISAAEGLAGYIEYNTDLFNADTIVRINSDFQETLRRVLSEPDKQITSLELPRPVKVACI